MRSSFPAGKAKVLPGTAFPSFPEADVSAAARFQRAISEIAMQYAGQRASGDLV